jgi:RNA polymerase sigma-70 factor (ECF subfamily)
VLFKVYRKVGEFRGDAALSSWIYRITFNAAMSRVRTAQFQRSQEEDRQIGVGRRRVGLSVAAGHRRLDQHGRRARPASQLPPSSVASDSGAARHLPCAVMLRDIHGMSTEEASAMLRVKDQTLKSRLHRGRLILRKQLADFAGGLTMHRPIYGT